MPEAGSIPKAPPVVHTPRGLILAFRSLLLSLKSAVRIPEIMKPVAIAFVQQPRIMKPVLC
jgi:hypothetical protein